MSRERELLQRALDALEMPSTSVYREGSELIADIRAELAKPEPVMYQRIEVENGRQVFTWNHAVLPDGKYKLYAERINEP
jgi:hypothetical protein